MRSAAIGKLPLAVGRFDDALWRALAHRLVRSSELRLDESGRRSSTIGHTSPGGVVRVREPATYREVARHGSIGLGRAYAAGWWDADDLVAVLRTLTRRVAAPSRVRRHALTVSGLMRDAWARSGAGKDRDRHDVQAHYDLGDEFFALFLDPTLTYSCAYFAHPGMSLEEASVAKLERICELAEVSGRDAILEIGTGWGSFAVHAAARYGCTVTTTTISSRQNLFAKQRVSDQGLDSKVTVLDLDYRDLHGQFDKVVSIEMIEAVGWRQLDAFLAACARLLRPGGILVLQAIVIEDQAFESSKRRKDFIKSEIFPGTTIPSVRSILEAARKTKGLRLAECHDIGMHYVETLARWRRQLLEEKSAVRALGFDEYFLRLWEFYLAYCEAGFAERRISDVQLVFEAPRARRRRGTPVL